jgi:predicted CXXCH cytochrome family protein
MSTVTQHGSRSRREERSWLRFAIPCTAVFMLIMVVPGVRAFHDGNVARCGACHVEHMSEDGAPTSEPVTGELLRGASPSEICLTCHADSLGRVLGGNPQAPPPEMGAGNFVFLLSNNLNDGPDAVTNPIPGDAAGHNLVAPSWGLMTDSRFSVSPGGTYPANRMGCTSCHDPHGGGKYRLLYGAGKTQANGFLFVFPAPAAVGIDISGPGESTTNHNAYQGGMSAWCGNCHDPRYHDRYPTPRFDRHPTHRALSGQVRATYNSYDGDSNPQGGNPASSYLPQVPFVDLSMTTSTTSGPGGGARIMCLTCHRAHASSAPSSGRWDFNVSLLSEDGVASGSYPIPDPYQDPAQGQLCHKCHDFDFGGK